MGVRDVCLSGIEHNAVTCTKRYYEIHVDLMDGINW